MRVEGEGLIEELFDVFLLVKVWWEFCDTYGIKVVKQIDSNEFFRDLRSLKRLYDSLKGLIDLSDREGVERKVYAFFEWCIVKRRRSLMYAYRYVSEFFSNDDEVVGEVVDAYERYVKERWGIVLVIDRADWFVRRACYAVKKVADEFGISVYDCIRFQHECWERISSPIRFESMTEERIRKRLKVYFDVRSGEVIKVERVERERREEKGRREEYSVQDERFWELEKAWRDVRSIGFSSFLKIVKGGFLYDVVKEILEQLREVQDREKVLKLYTLERVYERWKSEGYPVLILE
ncbi:MAG: hypothetical protein QXR17_06840 [Candidatus Bathyarchaeia archaeon]